MAGFAFPLPFTVICELLGVPEPDREPLGRGLVAMLVATPMPETYDRAKQASDDVVGRLRDLVQAKHDAPGDDLGPADRRSRRRGRSRRAGALSTIFQLIVAGHDTTTTFIGNAVVGLLDHPDQLELLRRDRERLPAALEELLRFDAPVPHSTFRYAAEPVEVAGQVIPAGAQVIVCLAAANRDPRRFDEPDRLDLARSERGTSASGTGSTTASAPRWPGSRASWRCGPC